MSCVGGLIVPPLVLVISTTSLIYGLLVFHQPCMRSAVVIIGSSAVDICHPVIIRASGINLGSVKIKLISLLFCMRLISLHCQKNCVWTSLKCHTSPTSNQCGVRLSSKRPSRVIWWRKICPYSATIISWIRGFCHGFSSLIFFDDYILLSAAKISPCNFLSVLLTFCVVPIG